VRRHNGQRVVAFLVDLPVSQNVSAWQILGVWMGYVILVEGVVLPLDEVTERGE